MEVDNERVDDEDAGDEVQNVKDLQMLEQLHLGNGNETTLLLQIVLIIST
jgi:hypothetical protein